MGKRYLVRNVLKESYERMLRVFKTPHYRPIVSFSGGKDSGVVLELAIAAARETGRLPVEAQICDEEAMFPGTPEYLERVANRKEVKFHWNILHYPQVNIFNREMPFWWVFDDQLKPHQWMRPLPKTAHPLKEMEIALVVNPKNFPIDTKGGERICNILGIRCGESRFRSLAMQSSRSWLMGGKGKNKKSKEFVDVAWPIYDWSTPDVWLAYKEFKWDYNHAYDGFTRMQVPTHVQRVAPPTMIPASLRLLRPARALWPRWFDKLCERLPGVRQGVEFGGYMLFPQRRLGETWKECYHRVILGPDAPGWIRERGYLFMEKVLKKHEQHSSTEFPQTAGCSLCHVQYGSWDSMCHAMYNGDPFGYRQRLLPLVEPDFFRPGSGTWKYGADKLPRWAKDLEDFDRQESAKEVHGA